MTTTLGGGLGSFAAIAAQPTYGNPFVTPTRTLTFKSAKPTFNPHRVTGTPYLRYNQIIDQGSASILTWLDAQVTLTGDVVSTGHALLLASAFATTSTLTELGTTTAYSIGGASGFSLSQPDSNNGVGSGCCFDMQLGVPTTDATLHPQNYHSCVVTKAMWTFDRTGLVSYEYDLDCQTVEFTTGLIVPTEPAGPVPFSMVYPSSAVKIGTLGSEQVIDGFRKCTITLTRGLDTNRIYLGSTLKEIPVTNAIATIDVSIDADWTPNAKVDLFDTWLSNTPVSVVATAVGGPIGSGGFNNQFQLNATNCLIQTGGEPPLDGPDLIKNTVALKGYYSSAENNPLTGLLYTSDTGW